MTTVENNKLIAEFMEMDFNPDLERVFINGKWRHSKVYFDTAWDWLMPVVEKIGKTDTGDYGEPFDSVSLYSSIEMVWNEVVKFIEWYNAQSIPIMGDFDKNGDCI